MNQEDRISTSDECISIAIRNLSSLTATSIELPSSLNQSLIEGANKDFIKWFVDDYLPVSLIKRISKKVISEQDLNQV
jgi:hypothetical protein